METYKEKDVVIMKLLPEDLDNPQETLAQLEHLLQVDFERKFVADLSNIDAIFSIQIGTLVSMHVLCYENTAIIKLASASTKVTDLLRMVGLEAMMEMHHGPTVAAQSFGPSATPNNEPKSTPQHRIRPKRIF